MLPALRVLLFPVLLLAIALPVAAVGSGGSAAPEQGRDVLLLSQRYGETLHVLDASSLETIAKVRFDRMVEGVVASGESGRLFLPVGLPDGRGCCELVSLDLETMAGCVLAWPAVDATVGEGRAEVYVVRGSVGIERFEARSLDRLPTLQGPGTYDVHPAPDGRWLYGLTYFRGPSLDVFDLEGGALTARHFLGEPESHVQFGGAWVGGRFYLYVHDGRAAYLQAVSPDDEPLDYRRLYPLTVSGVSVPVDELPRLWNVDVLAAGDRMLVYHQLGDWFKGNPRRPDWDHLVGGTVHGGVFVIDVEAGAVVAHLAPQTDFAFVVSDEHGEALYGIVAGETESGAAPRLLRLDGRTGAIITERALEDDIWRVHYTRLPERLIPAASTHAGPCP